MTHRYVPTSSTTSPGSFAAGPSNVLNHPPRRARDATADLFAFGATGPAYKSEPGDTFLFSNCGPAGSRTPKAFAAVLQTGGRPRRPR